MSILCFIIHNLNQQIFFLASQGHYIDTENRVYSNTILIVLIEMALLRITCLLNVIKLKLGTVRKFCSNRGEKFFIEHKYAYVCACAHVYVYDWIMWNYSFCMAKRDKYKQYHMVHVRIYIYFRFQLPYQSGNKDSNV